MVNYKNGKIYKLWSPEGDMIYIGSTCLSLARRKACHKDVPRTTSKILFDTYTDIRIELIEEHPCDNKEQLNRKEGEHIRMLDCVNRCVAGRTCKEWREDNKEKYMESQMEWREANKEKYMEYREENKERIAERKKEYNQDNKEHIAEQRKEYYQKNKERLQEKQKEYREKNKERLSEYKREYRERKRLEKVSIST